MRGGVAATAAVLGLVLAVPVLPAAADDAPFVPTTDLLPPLVTDDPALDRAEDCGPDGLVCVRYVEEQLFAWQDHFGCDHRAVFPTVYRLLTRQTRLVLEDDPSFFEDPAGLGWEALQFYELYLDMITAHLAGRQIPPAWQTAMDVALDGDWTAGHDMLLAINAHVQRDMPFAVGEVGLNLPDGSSRKTDHDRFNQILNDAYDTIVAEVGRRYDPFMDTIDQVGLIVDNVGAQQLVAGWREGVWRNAERVVAARGTGLEEFTVQSIEVYANTWAQLLRVVEIPGHRALRDAHCQAALAAGDPADKDAVRRETASVSLPRLHLAPLTHWLRR